MNITNDVIRDLLPLYADNAVSDDTRRLVEEYLRIHPELARELEPESDPLARPVARQTANAELASLNAAKRRLNMRSVWMALGIFFCAGIFAFTFQDDKMTWIWSSFPWGSVVMSVLGFFSWLLYGLNKRSSRKIGV